MERKQRSDDALVKDLTFLIRELVDALDDSAGRLTKKQAAMSLRNLQRTADGRGKAPPVHRGTPLERYTSDWTDYVSGKKASLDKRAIRFLCWVPGIATDGRFLAAFKSSGIGPSRRTLAGLVRSCHCMWDDMPRISPSIDIVRGLLQAYGGSDKVLRKWQAHIEVLLAKDAPRRMADKLVGGERSLASFMEEWCIEPQSDFFRRVVVIACAACRNRLDGLDRALFVLLFRDLLPWPGWDPPTFKREIGALIQHDPMSERSRETIQRFVLHFEGLGDPRLSANRVQWAEVPIAAKERMIDWLCKENPYVFSEHVYQQGEGWVWKQRASPHDPLSFRDA